MDKFKVRKAGLPLRLPDGHEPACAPPEGRSDLGAHAAGGAAGRVPEARRGGPSGGRVDRRALPPHGGAPPH